MAVVSINGKQYLVKEGEVFAVSHLEMEEGKKFSVKDMLTGKEMEAEVVGQRRGKKIRVMKFRNKTREKKTIGYRSEESLVKLAAKGKAAPTKEKAVKAEEKSPKERTSKSSAKKEG